MLGTSYVKSSHNIKLQLMTKVSGLSENCGLKDDVEFIINFPTTGPWPVLVLARPVSQNLTALYVAQFAPRPWNASVVPEGN